jgi:hypothetical protein
MSGSCSLRICAYCLMSNHWYFALWPERDARTLRIVDVDVVRAVGDGVEESLAGQHLFGGQWVQRSDVAGFADADPGRPSETLVGARSLAYPFLHLLSP